MQYELDDVVMFDGGPAIVIGRDTEERTYLIEFTGLTGKRIKTVTGRDLEDAPIEWSKTSRIELLHEAVTLKEQLKELERQMSDLRNKLKGAEDMRRLYQDKYYSTEEGRPDDMIPF